jgi:phage shock protein PspC (stress-responsive transcriptional regulator)
MNKQLIRSQQDRMIGGVCGGLAEYFKLDPTLVRLAFVLMAFAKGFGLLVYFILLVLMPLGSPATEEE